ncbi:hypothetical protein Ciccas_014462 [Cichlidogyrus casuarinus]|uniref:Uncharacterized protein n=1 Tax=Cichlidogyrus casuarinus TaxID=1844966 RepID=A0ABD2PI79_9PLAT
MSQMMQLKLERHRPEAENLVLKRHDSNVSNGPDSTSQHISVMSSTKSAGAPQLLLKRRSYVPKEVHNGIVFSDKRRSRVRSMFESVGSLDNGHKLMAEHEASTCSDAQQHKVHKNPFLVNTSSKVIRIRPYSQYLENKPKPAQSTDNLSQTELCTMVGHAVRTIQAPNGDSKRSSVVFYPVSSNSGVSTSRSFQFDRIQPEQASNSNSQSAHHNYFTTVTSPYSSRHLTRFVPYSPCRI